MSAPGLRETAPAKINLSLLVRGRRADGYHELQSLVVFADCGDALTATPAPALSFDMTGPFARGLAGEDNNHVLKAVRLFDDSFGVKTAAHLVLEKNLPVASGIGGGSADAAAALRLLARLHDMDVPAHTRAAIALCIGADVPVCLETRPAIMWGKGEMMRRLDAMPAFWLVLANPGVALSTPAVFKALDAPVLPEKQPGPETPAFADFEALVTWLEGHGNDLETPASALAPAVADVLSALRTTQGCRLARMSGSGATCFGLYESEAEARRAEAALRVTHPNWWVAAAKRL
jgi:4-diphosphocytidyl-2-C-methyl-D-erythritol kinase